MTAMNKKSFRAGPIRLVVLVLASGFSATRADVGPAVRVTMPADAPMAVAGRIYQGAFNVVLGEPGVVDDIEISGAGWIVRSIDAPLAGQQLNAGMVRVAFTAIPSDPNAPIMLSARFNGRRISHAYRIGPEAFGRRDHPDRVARLAVPSKEVPVAPDAPAPDGASRSAGGAIPLRFTGRIVYLRPSGFDVNGDPILVNGTNEGVDNVFVQVMDSDPVIDEAIWSGFTNAAGYFDSGVIMWDDCDITGCDTPDIYLRWETDTPVVNVLDATDILLPSYSWSNVASVIDDFTGTEHDFGTHTPLALADMPALFIHNSVTRAHRFIQTKSGLSLDTPEVDVLWPVSASNAFYDGDINIPVSREWRDDTHNHEYGHHFIENFAANIAPDYCNDFCDGTASCTAGVNCEDPGHCRWCPETDHDAWNEGFPNWLADIVTRDYPFTYTFSDGRPYEALRDRSLESIGTCCQDGGTYSPFLTEGFLGALLRDIEDRADLLGNSLQDDEDGDGFGDCLALGYDEIFTVAAVDDVTTPAGFLAAFRSRFPQHTAALYSTAFNVHPSYVNGFPADVTPPGAVQTATSLSHPVGVGGPLPCIEVRLEVPPDDVTGACAYSYEWSQIPQGVEPDMIEDITGSCVTVISHAQSFGDHYLSVRAMDCANHWSTEWATFGPYTVNECNGNGILDICEIAPFANSESCNASVFGATGQLSCTPSPSFCSTLFFSACGQGSDCQPNLVPDDCDINSGDSEDCNEDGIPDECQPMKHFPPTDIVPSSDWGNAANWQEAEIPLDGEIACVQPDPAVTAVVYEQDNTLLESLACHTDFAIRGAVFPAQFPRPKLSLNADSFIRGDFEMTGNSTLTVNDRLLIDGRFIWNDGQIFGNGTTEVTGGLNLTQKSVDLTSGLLNLTGGASISDGPRIVLRSGADVLIGSQASYTYQGNSAVFDGGSGLVDVRGTLSCAAVGGNATATLFAPVDNSGLIRVTAGTLNLGLGGNHTGRLLGDPATTLKLNRDHTLNPTSELTVHRVDLAGLNTSSVHGTVNIGDTLVGSSGTWNFEPDAQITSYGQHLEMDGGTINFNAPTNLPIPFQTVNISRGSAKFNTGQPVNVGDFFMINGTVMGPSPINVSGQFSWTNGSFFPGGLITANGPVLINATSSSRTLARHLTIHGPATVRAGFTLNSGRRVTILPTAVFDLQFNNGSIGSGILDNQGMIVRSSGTGQINLGSNILNSSQISNLTGTLGLTGGGTHTGSVTSAPGTTLIIGGSNHTFETGSTITTPNLVLSAFSSVCHGTVDVADQLSCENCSFTFDTDANIINYGNDLTIVHGHPTFKAPTDRPIDFNSVSILPNFNGGSVSFDTGQPVNIGTFFMGNSGNILGSSPINVSGQFTWNIGTFFPGGPVTLNGPTTVNITSSQRTSSRNIFNNGPMIIHGGFSLSSGRTLTNSTTGIVTLPDNFSRISSGTFQNDGMLIKEAGVNPGVFQNTDLFNAGTVEIQSAELRLNAADYIQSAGQTLLDSGDLRIVSSTVPITFDGGLLTGNGTLFGDVQNNGAAVSPGLSAGDLTVDGNYTQALGATYDVEIGGTAPGQFDTLTVTGNAILAGELRVTDVPPFAPMPGDSFVILTAASVSGTFDIESVPAHYRVVYNPTDVTLEFAAPSPDLNNDGAVDLRDWALLQTCHAGPGQPPSSNCAPAVNADLDVDGDVDLDDYALFSVALNL